MTEGQASESARVLDARTRAERRLRRQRQATRPLGLLLLAAVTVSAVTGRPAPGLRGQPLAVTIALVVFAGALFVSVRPGFIERSVRFQAAVIGTMGATGVALTAVQPHGATELAGGAAVWIAMARLPAPVGTVLAAAVTVGLALALGLADGSAAAVLATVLLCTLLGLVAYFLAQARAGQAATEVLLARLEDAREEQVAAAAVGERARIAGELHDVLAHSLSAAAIQLQGARKLAERDGASSEVRAVIDRAGELVKDGLADARQAVGALRGDRLPDIGQLESLIATFRDDVHAEVTLRIEGSVRPLPADASLALYRGAQEALTNVSRYAPGAVTSVVLRYDSGRTTLTVEDTDSGANGGLAGVGGGRGLAGLRERLERAGGSMRAGPTERGWLVELDVPG